MKNNYCTNCGKKLTAYELVCSKCNTPIVDISKEKKVVEEKEIIKEPDPKQIEKNLKNRSKNIIVISILVIIVSLVLIVVASIKIINQHNKNNAVKTFLKKTYPDQTFKVKYSSSGKCILRGECENGMDEISCDGSVFIPGCKPYVYESDCKAYYYDAVSNKQIIKETVYQYGDEGKLYTIEGKYVKSREVIDLE